MSNILIKTIESHNVDQIQPSLGVGLAGSFEFLIVCKQTFVKNRAGLWWPFVDTTNIQNCLPNPVIAGFNPIYDLKLPLVKWTFHKPPSPMAVQMVCACPLMNGQVEKKIEFCLSI